MYNIHRFNTYYFENIIFLETALERSTLSSRDFTTLNRFKPKNHQKKKKKFVSLIIRSLAITKSQR